MSLDVFDSTIRNSDAEVAANAAPDLPAGFGDAFDSSLRYASEWNNSLAYSIARQRALASYYDDVKARTGVQLPLYDLGGNVSLDELNEAITKLPQDPSQPEPTYTPLSEGAIDAMTLRRMAAAHQDAAAMGARERTWGGAFGSFAGNVIGSLADPVQDAMLPLGGAGEVGVGLRALEFAGIGAGSEALTAAASGSSRERAVPGSSSEIPGEIAGAGLFGAGLGGAFGLLGKWLGAGRGALPRSVRDDVNAGASEAQLNASNVFPGAAAENVHRDAVIDAVRSVVSDEPVTAGGKFFEAYHGTPHDFDRFDIGKIGTGEGAQAYGYGLYFAEDQNIASHYATALSSAPGPIPDAVKDALKEIDYAGFETAGEAMSNIRAHQSDWMNRWDVENSAAARTIDQYIKENPRGNVYQVRINADVDHFLDWDKPLKDQPFILDATKRMGPDVERRVMREKYSPGKQLNDIIANEGLPLGQATDANISEAMRSAGIPGIKYLDAGSRGGDEAAATRNFVVFNHDDIQITHKNGQPMSPAEMADARLHPITFGEVPDVESFDRVPEAGEDTASYWEDRLEGASREERQALGATDHAGSSGAILQEMADKYGADTDLSAWSDADRERYFGTLDREAAAPDLTPEQIAGLADDPQLADVQAHDLDHLLEQNPDMEFTTQTRLDDGSYRLDSRPLKDVLAELTEEETAAKELQACVIGAEAAE